MTDRVEEIKRLREIIGIEAGENGIRNLRGMATRIYDAGYRLISTPKPDNETIGNYKLARGVLPWAPGDELPEDTLNRMRDKPSPTLEGLLLTNSEIGEAVKDIQHPLSDHWMTVAELVARAQIAKISAALEGKR